MVVDAHSHLFHPSWYPQAFNDQLASALGRGQSTSPHAARVLLRALSDASGECTVRAMDRAGIDHRIVLVVDWGLELGDAELSIEGIHEAVLGICARFSDRLTGFAGVDPRRPQAAELLGWAFDELGARGLKLHPTSESWTLHDERTVQLVEMAAQRGLVVLVHVGETFPGLVDRNASPQALLALAERFPEVTFVGGHAGFRRWREFGADGPLPPNLLLDVSGWQSFDDGGDALARELLEIIRRFRGQVVFGTDSPFFGLPGSDADLRWRGRVSEILGLADEPLGESFFDHPLLRLPTGRPVR
jgi:predicted TIM-barrel fold metal-dependent hydrolase